MPFTESLTITSSMGGTAKIARTGDAKLPIVKSLPAGQSGAIGAVVDATTLIDGLPTGHGLTTGDVVGVFWAAGLRVGMAVTAHAANSITVTTASGTGSALPAEDTVAIVSLRVLEDDVGFDGTAATMLSITANRRAAVEMLAAGGASILDSPIAIPAPAAMQDTGEGYCWASGVGPANPMAGAAAAIAFYNGSTDAATVNFGVLIA